VTRGDGEIGEEITEHARGLIGLPSYIAGLKDIPQIAFRGEIVLPKQAFLRLHGMTTTGGGAFANARNATAGTLRQLDTSLVQKRGLAVYVYDILFVSGEINCSSADEQFALFRTWGLPIVERMQKYTAIEQVIAWAQSSTTKELAEEQPIDLDGLVIKIQEFPIREQF
jgi:DNA ligase (NAD+)